ncbi:MAG: hypothetical protein M1122_02500 [Candidatus Marsarchaeota archaeon]|jgi:ribosomal protein S3AE|nr:hypothetical protein [Candidatus Marsarchaeota archaeon]
MATSGIEKWKTKKWFNIYTPEALGNSIIGEMPANDEKVILDRIIKVNMSWITNKMSHSFMVIGLKITDVNGDAAHTKIQYIEQTYSYLHSLVRRHSSTVYTVDKLKDKNGKDLVIKLMLVTGSKVTTPKKKAIGKTLSSFAREHIGGIDSDTLVKEIIEGNFQSEGIKTVSNIASINKLEVKKIEL